MRWRLIDGEVALWKDVLMAKYGASVGGGLMGVSRGSRDGLLFGGRN